MRDTEAVAGATVQDDMATELAEAEAAASMSVLRPTTAMQSAARGSNKTDTSFILGILDLEPLLLRIALIEGNHDGTWPV